MFQKLWSLLTLLSIGLSTQLLTILLTGIATGYLASIYHWHFVIDENYTVMTLLATIGFVLGSGVTALIIFSSTLYHLYRMSLGGEALAESLGGMPFDAHSPTAVIGSLAQLPEINQQVAAMFGIPAPKLYFLPQEEGINAFAAGKDPQSAVIGVTRGMRRMDDKQLRGILAHEMAHICNGDMQHNMRLLAIVLGLKSIQLTSQKLIQLGIYWLNCPSRYWRFALFQIKWGVICVLLGLVCFPMGVVGSLIGSVMLAFTNRRRELRADRIACAVLNDPSAVADALKMILGDNVGARIARPHSRAFGHVMFAQANGCSGGLLGSHPTLQMRIRAQDKNWDGMPLFEADAPESEVSDNDGQGSAPQSCSAPSQPNPLRNISSQIIALFQDPSATVVTLPALLLFAESDRPRVQFLQGGQLVSPIQSMWSLLDGLETDERIALLDLSRETVSQLNKKAANEVLAVVDDLTDSAGENAWDLQAWRALIRISTQRPTKMPRAKIGRLTDIYRDLVELVSIMSIAAEDGGLAEFRFHSAWARLGLHQAGVLPAEVLAWPDLDATLKKASHTPALLRRQIAEACVVALTADGRVDATQAAVSRIVCERLGQPHMGLLPGRVTHCL